MTRKITVDQLSRAIRTAPREVEIEADKYLKRSIREYRIVAERSSPWRVGQSGGGIPVDTRNLKQKHRVKPLSKFSISYGVAEESVPYAKYVHGRKRNETNKRTGVKSRPWLEYAQEKADHKVEKHYKVMMDNILSHIAT